MLIHWSRCTGGIFPADLTTHRRLNSNILPPIHPSIHASRSRPFSAPVSPLTQPCSVDGTNVWTVYVTLLLSTWRVNDRLQGRPRLLSSSPCWNEWDQTLCSQNHTGVRKIKKGVNTSHSRLSWLPVNHITDATTSGLKPSVAFWNRCVTKSTYILSIVKKNVSWFGGNFS